VYPHVGGNAQSQVNGIPKTGSMPLPYKKTAETPNLGIQDQADDIRGGMGWDGLMELVKFVREGGTLLTEGATATIFPEYNITSGVSVESPTGLFVRGSVVRGVVSDRRSPIAYGYDAQLPVYFSQSPVLNAGGGDGGFGGGGGRGGGGIPGVGMNTTPMAGQAQHRVSPWDPDAPDGGASSVRGGRGGDPGQGGGRGGRGGGGGFGGFGGDDAASRPRVILSFPSNPDDMLLSGVLVGGQALANRAQVVDAPLGQGHVVSFAIRPFWRWKTQVSYFRGFNTILNWNDLNAGRATPTRTTPTGGGQAP
jgi:hypothetical protein